jgi:hypothetical protein
MPFTTPLLVLIEAAAVFLAAVVALAPSGPPAKKLLQWGWDQPDTAYLRDHLAEMERSPFDGCVFGVRYVSAGTAGSFSWEAWGRRRFTASDLASAFADLRALRPRRFTELFLRLNVTPGDVGWFQDHSAIVANARLAAELARVGRARGVLLDVEQYRGQLFDYRRQPLAEAYGWNAYARQVRLRGREVMAALEDGYPGLTLFLTFGHSLPWAQIIAPAPLGGSEPYGAGPARNLPLGARRSLGAVSYGLLAPFVDGLLEGARGGTRVVDGFELSYGFKDAKEFAAARRLVFREAVSIAIAPASYRRRLRLGFGLWLDYDWHRRGWRTDDLERNYFSPATFDGAVRAALAATDEYVWVYAETPRWWPTAATDASVPEAYRRVLRRVRDDSR